MMLDLMWFFVEKLNFFNVFLSRDFFFFEVCDRVSV